MSTSTISKTKRVVRTDAFVWALKELGAIRALTMPPEQCARYATSNDAKMAQATGNDGYEGETLYRVTIEEDHT